MAKISLKYFVSYAHKTEKLTADFLDKFEDHAAISKKYTLEKWIDGDIIIGEDWHQQIQDAIAQCDFGLLLLSSTYFTRKYIKEHELSHFIKPKGSDNQIITPIIPVGLESFDFSGDLLGLEATQIFRYKKAPGEPLQFYNELRHNNRIQFIQSLLQGMTLKFNKIYTSGR